MTDQEEVLLKALIAMIQADGIIAPEDQWAIGHYIRTLQK